MNTGIRQNRPFLRYLISRMLNRFGDSIDVFLVSWLVYGLSGSASLSALAVGLNYLPTILLQPLAGAFVEHIPKRRVIALTDVGRALLVAIFIGLYLTGNLNAAVLVVGTFFISTLEAFASPASSAALSGLLQAEKYDSGMSLYQAGSRIMELAGTGAAGFLIAATGSGALSAMGICTTVGMLLGAGLYSAAAGGRNESKEGKVSIDRILLGCGILMGSYYLVLAWLGLAHPVDAVFYPVLFTASLLFGVSVGLANTAVSVLLLRVVPTSYMARASAVMNAGCTAAVPFTSFLVSGVCARASVISVLAGTAVPVFVVIVVLMGKGTLKRLNDFGQEKDGGLRDTDNQDRCEKRKGRAGDAD